MSTETGAGTDVRSTDGESAVMWIVALLGVWIFVTPFFLGGPDAGGVWNFGGGWLYWSNILTGILVAALGAYGAYASD